LAIKSRARDLAKAAVIAALYITLVWTLAPISFGAIQVRVSNALIGIVPLIGMPAVAGITIGVLFGNILSPLGPIDLLSAVPTFVALLLVMKLKSRSVFVGLLAYSLILSVWVGILLNYVLGIPFLAAFIYLLAGISFTTTVLGYLVYKTLGRLLEMK